jgi:hypothetical protein
MHEGVENIYLRRDVLSFLQAAGDIRSQVRASAPSSSSCRPKYKAVSSMESNKYASLRFYFI